MRNTSILAFSTLLLALVLGASSSAIAHENQQVGQPQSLIAYPSNEILAEHAHLLKEMGRLHGVEVSDVSFQQSARDEGEHGLMDTSCTAMATISIPGGTGVEVSATAPTCAEAVEMLMDVIEAF